MAVTNSQNQEQNELGEFLRARRSELSPNDVDLPEGGTQRRVAGLRREEVAQFAAISIDYYTRLEQGRINPSTPVLASLARVHLSGPVSLCAAVCMTPTPCRVRSRGAREGSSWE